MGDDGTTVAPTETPESRQRLFDWLDVVAKLIGAVGVLIVAYAANGFQAKANQQSLRNQDRTTGLTLQSQREQAESQLRAAMFSSLIQPFAGAEKGLLAVDREELLAQLLVLNFSEDFESKPLMERVDARLAIERPAKWQSVRTSVDRREGLRAIVRRVADRQISSLSWYWNRTKSGEQQQHGCEVYWLNLGSEIEPEPKTSTKTMSCTLDRRLGELISIPSPDANSSLDIFLSKPDWKNETLAISVQAQANAVGEDERHNAPIAYNFTLSWFDLPLTDNTVLPNGARFAINLRAFDKELKKVAIRVIWFPPGYFTVRERPLDPRKILGLLAEAEEK